MLSHPRKIKIEQRLKGNYHLCVCIDAYVYACTYVHKEGRKEMFYLMTHSTHFIYGYMASDIW